LKIIGHGNSDNNLESPCVTFPVSHGCETWSLALKEERRLRMYEKAAPTRVSGLNREEEEDGEKCIMRGFVICNIHQVYDDE
jgi:hypothetical protein